MKTLNHSPLKKWLHLFQIGLPFREWRSVWLCLLMLCAGYTAKADAPKVKGYYIDNAGVRHEVTIIVFTELFSDKVQFSSHQYFFKYLDKKGNKVKVAPQDAREYGFTYLNKKYLFKSMPDIKPSSMLGIEHVANFHHVLLQGACQVYQYEISRSNTSGGATFETTYILLRSNEDLYYTNTGFNTLTANKNNNSLEEYFADCPELVAKIKAKEFKKMDDKWVKIAEFYNKNCQSGASATEESDSE